MITLETQVAGIMNSVISLVSQAASLKVSIDQLSTYWNSLGGNAAVAAFPTTALTSTGGLGVADATPNEAHPIDLRLAPGNLVSRAISPTDLGAMLTLLQGISACIGGAAVAADASAGNLIAKAS